VKFGVGETSGSRWAVLFLDAWIWSWDAVLSGMGYISREIRKEGENINNSFIQRFALTRVCFLFLFGFFVILLADIHSLIIKAIHIHYNLTLTTTTHSHSNTFTTS
jgi:hypothetical protein